MFSPVHYTQNVEKIIINYCNWVSWRKNSATKRLKPLYSSSSHTLRVLLSVDICEKDQYHTAKLKRWKIMEQQHHAVVIIPHHQRFSGEICLNPYTMLWFYAFGKEKVLATLYTCSKRFVYATILTEIISLKHCWCIMVVTQGTASVEEFI